MIQSCDLLETKLEESDRPCMGTFQLESETQDEQDVSEALIQKFMPILQVYDPELFVPENFGVVAQAVPLVEGVTCPQMEPTEYEEGDWAISYAYVYKQDEGIPDLRVILAERLSVTISDEVLSLLIVLNSQIKNDHPGDIEHVRIIVNVDGEGQSARIKYVEVKVHYNGFIRYEPEYATCTGSRVEILVGRDKNANHISQQTCQLSYGLAPFPEILGFIPIAFSGDVCEVNATVDTMSIYTSSHNIANGNPFENSEFLKAFRQNSVDSSVFEGDISPEFNFCEDSRIR